MSICTELAPGARKCPRVVDGDGNTPSPFLHALPLASEVANMWDSVR